MVNLIPRKSASVIFYKTDDAEMIKTMQKSVAIFYQKI